MVCVYLDPATNNAQFVQLIEFINPNTTYIHNKNFFIYIHKNKLIISIKSFHTKYLNSIYNSIHANKKTNILQVVLVISDYHFRFVPAIPPQYRKPKAVTNNLVLTTELRSEKGVVILMYVLLACQYL